MRSKRVIGEFGTGTSTSLQLFSSRRKSELSLKGNDGVRFQVDYGHDDTALVELCR